MTECNCEKTYEYEDNEGHLYRRCIDCHREFKQIDDQWEVSDEGSIQEFKGAQ